MLSSLGSTRPTFTWNFRGQTWRLGGLPKLMGILNVTPDSFSDGGQFLDSSRAVDRCLQLVAEGADLIDVGGESTRPNAEPVAKDEEIRRIVPVVAEVAKRVTVPISIDTTKAAVAERALDVGAAIVNDVSGLLFDPRMPDVCAQGQAGVICMHRQGTPQTMQINPRYADVVREVSDFLADRLVALEECGIARERVVVDPGIGFGKTPDHNLTILRHIMRFRALGRPVLIGHSRKRFLGKILGRKLDEVSAATIGVALAAALNGADILRVHDVGATRDALEACRAVLDDGGPPAS
ncbi:MAG TPA: dihydropteroate synthase [Planctomycetaceae bacterium]|jgi:dihydropteroate synthase|nr:dihydropteroate synthase [Planctomycetaceae bacterium]